MMWLLTKVMTRVERNAFLSLHKVNNNVVKKCLKLGVEEQPCSHLV